MSFAPHTLLALLRRQAFWVGAGFLALLTWVYWPTLLRLSREWRATAEYSHGFLVPVFALYLLYRRREQFAAASYSLDWRGLPLLLVGGAGLLAGASIGVDYVEAASLIPCLAGVAVLLGGWPALRWAGPSILFLLAMIPLPFRVAHALSGSLRGIATQASGYTLQTLGFPVVIEGHILLLDGHTIAVAEACSGLSMLFVFVALSFAVAVVCERPLLDRVVVVLASFPIAVVANIFRITVTAAAYQWVGREWGEFIFHDLAGWIMTPLALGLLLLVLKFLDLILISPQQSAQAEVSAKANLGGLIRGALPQGSPGPPSATPS